MGFLDPFPIHDIIYGLRHENIIARLTPQNWHEKAVVRIIGDAWIYLWIRQLTSGDQVLYYVRCHALQSVAEFETQFVDIEKALAYANGEDGGFIAQKSRVANRDEWPPEASPPTTVSGRA